MFSKALKIKDFLSHRKATEKLPKSVKPLKIKDLLKFFSVFRFCYPDPPPDPPPPPGTIFAGKTPDISIHFSTTEKPKNKKQKIKKNIERVGFHGFSVFFSVAFRWFFGCLTISKTCIITKPRPPHPPPLSMLKTVENQALAWCLAKRWKSRSWCMWLELL